MLIAKPIVDGSILLDSWNVQWGWRYMFWAGAIPSVAFFALILIIPESPRWLASQYKYDKAESIFTKIGGVKFAIEQIEELKSAVSATKEAVSYKMLFEGKMPKILLLGIVIGAFQQWCGINVVFNYAQEIFSVMGYGVSDILFNIVITGLTNLIFTYVGMPLVDKLGRRPLMLFGSIGLACIYTLLGLCYYFAVTGGRCFNTCNSCYRLLCHDACTSNLGSFIRDISRKNSGNGNGCKHLFIMDCLFCAYLYIPVIK